MFGNIRALVVEDDALSLLAIAALLKGMGIYFKRNTTGAGVVQQVTTMQPSFVLLDVDLPDGDPAAICHAIRNDPRTAHIPVIAIANEFSPSLVDKLNESRVDRYLKKPLSQYEFVAQLTQILAVGQRHSG
jgi:CheY-like chemotaxis protein